MPVTLETQLRRGDDFISAPVNAQETVMISLVDGKYYELNLVAALIWELLEIPQSVAELCAVIEEEFKIDAATCRADVLRFVGDLMRDGIVEEVAR